MIGVFVPWGDSPRPPGYIIDGNGCHVWVGNIGPGGYGIVRVDGRRQMVHRVRYETEVGTVPDGMVLDHFACDNRACCNPRHVRPASTRENVLRGVGLSALNAAKTHCKRGHELTPDNLCPANLKRGARNCRRCHAIAEARRRERLGPAYWEYRRELRRRVRLEQHTPGLRNAVQGFEARMIPGEPADVLPFDRGLSA